MTRSVPYENARSGAAAREDISRMLERFGCERIGFMDHFTEHAVLLAFTHRGRNVQLKASAKGWAALYLRMHPYSYRHRSTRQQYEAAALKQGLVAVNSILRDWVKGQITAVECGMLSFEAVFLPHLLTSEGRPLIDHLRERKALPEVMEATG